MMTTSSPDQRGSSRGVQFRRRLEGLADDHVISVAALVATVYVAAFLAASLVLPQESTGATILVDIVYVLPCFVAVPLLVVAARRTHTCRCFWYLTAASVTAELLGDATWAVYGLLLGRAPLPSPGDVFYLAAPLLVIAAALTACPLSPRRWRDLPDLGIPFAAVVYVVYEFTIRPQLAGGVDAATLVSVTECAAEVLAGLVFTVLLSGYRNVATSVKLIYASVVAQAVSYPVYAYAVAVHGWHATNWVYTGWQLARVLVILGALVRVRRGEPDAKPAANQRDVHVWMITGGLALVLATFTVRFHQGRLDAEAPYVALAAITIALVRLHQALSQRGRLAVDLRAALAVQERLASTDPLTEIVNRRAFDRLLPQVITDADRSGSAVGLASIDLDYFKRVNDGYGHPAGDETLRQVTARLHRAVRPGDMLARMGGEEFALLAPGIQPDDLVRLAERCRVAISADPFTIDGQMIHLTASVGAAAYPDDAQSTDELAQVADRALYEAKRRGRNCVHVGAAGVQVRTLPLPESTALSFLEGLADRLDREQSEHEHSIAMLEVAARLCDAFHLSAAERRRCLTAARLHDIGKVGIPAAILTKPGPLSEDEWNVMQEHVRIGVDLLTRCPETREVAFIVGEHHERPDGRGYPANKRGEEISIEAKIISVADAWTAMLADRPYRAALTPGQARAEILAGRGSQFDERAVDALLAITDADMIRPHAA
jgi:diguanylate cyclase (GGDEF)-like protein/putative nucleotidyltransferase with HDIG domain